MANMKIVALSGSIVGSKTKTAMLKTVEIFSQKYPQHEVTLLDLADYTLEFSDGRNYFEYEGDTKYVTETIMAADAIIIGTPTFQASIPATLKNIFDLLPVNAFRDKVEIGRASCRESVYSSWTAGALDGMWRDTQ